MAGTRRDVATLGAGWNDTLLNYALAMRALDELPITNRNSWRFLGAMHGFDQNLWVREGVIGEDDAVPADITDDNSFGNQCAHGSWYFLPWHRAYLGSFEAIVAAKVKELSGDDWALPYWNYLDTTNPDAGRIPDAFLADELPNGGGENPLRKYPRRPGITQLPPPFPRRFSLESMDEDDFLVSDDGSIGFGGGVTNDFIQFDGMTGDLENNPHNTVHGMVGGFMGNALTAGLDPIFWLHHCNIDRLWEAWMATPGKRMTRERDWREGPHDRNFIMPDVGSNKPGVRFRAPDTLRGGRYYPQYDDLTKGTGVTPAGGTVARVAMGPPEAQTVEPIGAAAQSAVVGDSATVVRVDLDARAAASGVAAMGTTVPGEVVTRLYVALRMVRGSAPSPELGVYLNVPEGASPADHPDLLAGHLTLFGLNVASDPDGRHGGNGLGFTLDITDLASRLEAAGQFNPDQLRVTLVPEEGISAASPVTVEEVSVLKRTGTVG